MAEPHAPCRRCGATDAAAFDGPTSTYCCRCWEWMTDHGRRFGEWIEEQLAPKARVFWL